MDYFGRPRSSPANASTPQTPRTPSAFPPATPATPRVDGQSRLRPPPPFHIRRLPSGSSLSSVNSGVLDGNQGQTGEIAGRRRSLSAPQRFQAGSSSPANLRKQQTNAAGLASVAEEGQTGATPPAIDSLAPLPQTRERRTSNAASTAAEWVLGRPRRSSSTSRPVYQDPNYERDVVDMLDVIDPEISTLTTLNNVQNSLFVPFEISRYFNRQQTYDLSRHPTALTRQASTISRTQTLSRIPTVDEAVELEKQPTNTDGPGIFGAPLSHSHSISSHLSETNYAVLPHGVVLQGWSEEDKIELNDYVRHLLHSRRAKFRRSMRAFGKYVRTPLGAFVTIYSFLITFWGTAWILFIIGWLSAGGRQAYIVMICDQILVALFVLNGDVLAPFRAVDTYHLYFIIKYHYKSLRLRKERGLPPLEDVNDLPDGGGDNDVEAHPAKQEELVLTEEEQKIFDHHRAKFCRSHTYYKPHATFTHRAFSMDLLITIVVLLDFHSIFQIILGVLTWSISYHVRPAALTAVILACSLSCNISGGIVISVGDKKTRKKEIIEQLFRQALTEEALETFEKTKDLKAVKHEEALAKALASNGNDNEVDADVDVKTKHDDGPSNSSAGESTIPAIHVDGVVVSGK